MNRRFKVDLSELKKKAFVSLYISLLSLLITLMRTYRIKVGQAITFFNFFKM